LHPETLAFFRSHAWPGNVRELENMVQREFLLSDDAQIRIAPAGEAAACADSQAVPAHDSFQKAKARAIAQFERAYIGALLERTRGNLSLAARLCGKERSRLGKLMKKYGLDRQRFCRAP
jgi:DNA-binding NtrC family response regulator